MSVPSIRIRPVSGSSSRLMQRSNVLFPAPLSPTNATAPPLDTTNDTPLRAGCAPSPSSYDFVSSSTRTWGAAGIFNDANATRPALLGDLRQQVLCRIAMRRERRRHHHDELLHLSILQRGQQ